MAKKQNKSSNNLEWETIFSDLSYNYEPEIHYVKQVVITTKTGKNLKITAKQFYDLIEKENFDPELSFIENCEFTIDLAKISKEVDAYVGNLFSKFNSKRKSKIKT